MHPHVLQLDIQGTPQAWISLEQAVLHYATGSVAWEDGDLPLATLRGGFNVARGVQSRVEVAPIIALRGASKINLFDVIPSVTKNKLLVLRPALSRARPAMRARAARIARRPVDLDQPCERMRGLQQPQGCAHAGGSRHAAGLSALCAEPL